MRQISKILTSAILLLTVTLLAPTQTFAAGDLNMESAFDYVVQFQSPPQIEKLYQKYNLIYHKQMFAWSKDDGLKNIYRLTLPSAVKLSALKAESGVIWAEPDFKVKAALSANDEFFTEDSTSSSLQWYLPKIKTNTAWDIKKDSPSITVAMVDTGIDALHQDLKDGRVVAGYKIYCTELNSNGCTERVRGDIAAGVNSDDNSHGTSVASVLGAHTNNFAGMAGITWQVKLMPIKALNKDGLGTASDVAEGITWAAQNGAKVINLSLGSTALTDSTIFNVAINLAVGQGAIVVAAAGNDQSTGVDLDVNPTNPVCADGEDNNVLGVAATDLNDQKAVFSNYGANCIDVSAPGVRILTAYFDPEKPESHNVYAFRSGTSFAAPMVSAAAALMLAHKPELKLAQVKNHLVNFADDISAQNTTACGGVACDGKLGGRLNVLAALSAETDAPAGSKNPSPQEPEEPVDEPEEPEPIEIIIPPAEGTLFRGGGPTVYISNNGFKRPLTYLSFISYGFNFADVKVLDESYVESIRAGEIYPPKDGTLTKAENSPTVFIIKGENKQPLSFFSFTKHSFRFADVLSVGAEQLEFWPTLGAFAPPEGTLMRASSNPTVYVVESKVLHAMNAAAFGNRGYKFANVNTVSPEEIALYQKGVDYLH